MNTRKSKALRVGNATAVVLPVDWVRGHQIKQGDVLEVCYDGCVTIKAPARGARGSEDQKARAPKDEISPENPALSRVAPLDELEEHLSRNRFD